METTGDLDGVMDFLRNMVSSGKLSEEDGMSYIAQVLTTLQTLKASYNHQEVDPGQKLRHIIQVTLTLLGLTGSRPSVQVENEVRDADQEFKRRTLHQEKIDKINLEEEDLNKSKREIEEKIKVLTLE